MAEKKRSGKGNKKNRPYTRKSNKEKEKCTKKKKKKKAGTGLSETFRTQLVVKEQGQRGALGGLQR